MEDHLKIEKIFKFNSDLQRQTTIVRKKEKKEGQEKKDNKYYIYSAGNPAAI